MGFSEIHNSYTFQDCLGMSVGERQYIYMPVQACTYYTGVLKNPAHILYATSKKSRTYNLQCSLTMQFRQCSLTMQFDNAVLHFQNAIAVLTFPESICNFAFPGRISGGTFRFEFSWWDFPGRFSPANFLVGFSGRKITWTISTCKNLLHKILVGKLCEQFLPGIFRFDFSAGRSWWRSPVAETCVCR